MNPKRINPVEFAYKQAMVELQNLMTARYFNAPVEAGPAVEVSLRDERHRARRQSGDRVGRIEPN